MNEIKKLAEKYPSIVPRIKLVFTDPDIGSAFTVRCYHSRNFDSKYDPTVESYRKTIEIDGLQILLEIIDTGGTEQFAPMKELFIKEGHGFVLLFQLIIK
jgi:Ras-related protein Rap-1A/Ras-related protein Rap-1B